MRTDCADGSTRDLLPLFVHGTLSPDERTRVAAHLSACEACAEEVEVLRSVRGAWTGVRIDRSRIVAALPAAPRGRRSIFGAPSQWRIAAGISLLLIGGTSVAVLKTAFRGESGPVLPDSLIGAVSTDTGRPAVEVKLGKGTPGRAVGISFGGGVSDLTDVQLEALLKEIEKIKAVPSVEPETRLMPAISLEQGGGNAS